MEILAYIAISMVVLGFGYLGAALTALWVIPWSVRTKLIKFFFYFGSFLTCEGFGFSVLVDPFGTFMGADTRQWAAAFVTVQVIGVWLFVINIAIERLRVIIDGKVTIERKEEDDN